MASASHQRGTFAAPVSSALSVLGGLLLCFGLVVGQGDSGSAARLFLIAGVASTLSATVLVVVAMRRSGWRGRGLGALDLASLLNALPLLSVVLLVFLAASR